ALAQRRGAAIPPIEVYRVGCAHFVADGHHRVSIAAATRQRQIDAYVTHVRTEAPARPTCVLCPPAAEADRQERLATTRPPSDSSETSAQVPSSSRKPHWAPAAASTASRPEPSRLRTRYG